MANALDLIKIQDDKVFLLNQRKKGRPGAMIGCDRSLFEKEKRKNDRMEKEMLRKQKNSEEELETHETVDLFDEEVYQSDFSDFCADELDDDSILNSRNTKKRKFHQFISPKLVATLDKCKISERDAVRILIATAEALGHDVNSLSISKTTIRLCRKQFRSDAAEKLKADFKNKEINNVTVHWDGKILPSLAGTEKVDRLPVVVTSNGQEHLLGIPVLPTGTGKEQANAILTLLDQWNLTEKVLLIVNLSNL